MSEESTTPDQLELARRSIEAESIEEAFRERLAGSKG
jgi:hypothetical protein